MSCDSCSGSGGCEAENVDGGRAAIDTLLTACQKRCAPGQVMLETDAVLQEFNDLGHAVACGRARSLEPLATVFNKDGAEGTRNMHSVAVAGLHLFHSPPLYCPSQSTCPL